VDKRFWPQGHAPGGGAFWDSDAPGVVLNPALARELKVAAGDAVTLHVQKAESVPRESLLGRRNAEDVLDKFTLQVRLVLPDEGVARFTLSANPGTPRNALVPLGLVQARLGQGGRVNALLTGAPGGGLQAALRSHLTLDDWDLVLHTPEARARHAFRL